MRQSRVWNTLLSQTRRKPVLSTSYAVVNALNSWKTKDLDVFRNILRKHQSSWTGTSCLRRQFGWKREKGQSKTTRSGYVQRGKTLLEMVVEKCWNILMCCQGKMKVLVYGISRLNQRLRRKRKKGPSKTTRSGYVQRKQILMRAFKDKFSNIVACCRGKMTKIIAYATILSDPMSRISESKFATFQLDVTFTKTSPFDTFENIATH